MEEQEINLKDFLKGAYLIVKRRLVLIASITLILGGISIYKVKKLPVYYESYAIVDMAKINDKKIETPDALGVLFKNPLNPYLSAIAKTMGISEMEAYGLSQQFTIAEEADFLSILGKAGTPEMAKKLVELICFYIEERENKLLDEKKAFIFEEMADLKKQIVKLEDEMSVLDKKIKNKEGTTVLAQSNIYQSLLVNRRELNKELVDTRQNLKYKELSIKYNVKPAKVIAEPALPTFAVAENKKKIALIRLILSLLFSVVVAFIYDFIKMEL